MLKLYCSYGSEREYVLVNGRKPLSIYDLKQALFRLFKVAPEQQCIVFKGYNLHEYIDETPLDAFGLENNSPISFWYKIGNNNPLDIRLPVDRTPPQQPLPEAFSPRSIQLQQYKQQQLLPPSISQQNLQQPQQPYSTSSGNLNNWNSDPNLNLNSTEVIKVEVQHGSDRHQLILKGLNKNVTVLDLQNELERITTVPLREQRLFYKAQEMNTAPYKTLKEFDIDNNSVVKLVGDPAKLKYQNYFGRVMPVANTSTTFANGAVGASDPSAQLYNPNLSNNNYMSAQTQPYYGM